MRPSTLLVRPEATDDPHRPVVTPLYQTACFAVGSDGYDYTRSGNPTRTALEEKLARLEGDCRALAFSTGMAAVNAVRCLLRPGDEVLAGDDLYGGTWRLLSRLWEPSGIRVRYVDATDLAAVSAALTPRTRTGPSGRSRVS